VQPKLLFFVGVALSLLVAISTMRVIPLGLHIAFAEMLPHIELRPLAFLTHIIAASVALGIGGFQLWDTFRQRRIGWHRIAGRVYVFSVLVGGAGGFVLGLSALAGPIAQAGFVILAILWWITTIVAVINIRAGNIGTHRVWMFRSYALTFAAVTLRLQLVFFMIAGVDYVSASLWLAWTCWVPNLILVEWWIRNSKRGVVAQKNPRIE